MADIPSLKFPTSPTFLKAALEISRSAISLSTKYDLVVLPSYLTAITASVSPKP
jgi:hypothetical protein